MENNNSRRENDAQHVPFVDWLKITFVYCLVPVALFISAGDFQWVNAWIFSIAIVIAGVGGRIWAEKKHPGIVEERLSSIKIDKSNIKVWDKILAPLMAFSIGFPLPIIAGLDHRFMWSPIFSFWLSLMGFIFIISGYLFAVWALAENKFFSTVVRIQSERGHSVCDSGPYRMVRHPGYAGNVFALFGIVLFLNSIWALIPTLFALMITIMRTEKEDQTLKEELPGYADYAQRVHYKLFIGIY
ncbi:isoprenylcysteine carboxyl methyltransferase [bacterium (Candidatus Blackallbacteria) CG17_big_fil_post_rev_8_21_14_2_50_48_46]|uniref:Isoprenylcysteine carboxyl methyltransferase n=1 Tax=bacterium (Candidatus Blackallbacteria) CG17_big_fil_post_rev_8_21_14_2_50_48_46 TaxID=2014261 RepID=A0A2M7G1C8_9BACT|nr:MAG: isoprenylcysteine carboxyl methyltransferase [bacterium (Candidatus Blackallbacteria) CG18_big_fil_WC_8_21_14_2_50_49_26]PIW15522.1 MAG: isoprenylcysteine carboxyl methyltransferase [bacterium (Candidatus Blackallbacteria) CG17_big_fil_post_rev_8_21_14_2_50_48_46]PIW48577.1 MAG: isoprenylcysteine carboxyl methyltransferase [bacterium (Candidatus Blackallbacteria) CG13_big_fil_rev_8_21_14_2_50_49_14]